MKRQSSVPRPKVSHMSNETFDELKHVLKEALVKTVES